MKGRLKSDTGLIPPAQNLLKESEPGSIPNPKRVLSGASPPKRGLMRVACWIDLRLCGVGCKLDDARMKLFSSFEWKTDPERTSREVAWFLLVS